MLTEEDEIEIRCEAIARFIGDFIARWGRLSVRQTKEKYGTVRVYCGFGYYSLYGLLFPRYVYKHRLFPKWLWSFDIWYISPVLQYILPKLGSYKYQVFIYKLAYRIAVKRNPDIKDRILRSADYNELLKEIS